MSNRFNSVKKLIEYHCSNCDLFFWVEDPAPKVTLYCPNCSKTSFVNDDTIFVPIVGSIVNDEKLGNRVIFEK